MKTKKSEEKMKLNKTTVTNLSNREMHQAAGGVSCTQITAINCAPDTCLSRTEGTWV